MTTATFDQFQAMRRVVADLGPELAAVGADSEPGDGQPGLVYGATGLHIYTRAPHWKGLEAAAFEFLLVIGNVQWLSNDIAEVERHLYEYAVDEGYFTSTQEPAGLGG